MSAGMQRGHAHEDLGSLPAAAVATGVAQGLLYHKSGLRCAGTQYPGIELMHSLLLLHQVS